MATIKAFTDISQSKRLAEILPLESADMRYHTISHYNPYPCDEIVYTVEFGKASGIDIPAWSLTALFSLIKDKCGYFEFVYLKRTYDGRANPLDDVYRLSTDEYDVYNKEAVDACYEMIIKLNELKIL